MKHIGIPLLRRFLREEHGQSIVILAVTLTVTAALAGAGVDAGHVYVAYQQLVASTNAAALAGAQAMPNISLASSQVTKYSSQTGDLNVSPFLANAAITTNFYCSSTVGTTLDVACQAPSAGSCTSNSTCNALAVTQTAQVPLWFGGLIGVPTINLRVTSTTAMRGGFNTPWNIAIILDATSSMNDNDNGTSCSGTQELCARQGIQALLEDMYPCSVGITCSSTTTIADNVALYVFPPLLQSTAPQDYCSGGNSPTHEYYALPTLPYTSGSPSTSWTDTIIPFYSSSTTPTYPDYRTSDSSTGLNTSSNIVKASGYTGTSCNGVVATGGAHTYYAQVIYQAQSDLAALQSKNPQSQNAIILLGDGDQNATVDITGSNKCGTSNNFSGGYCTSNYSSSSDLVPSANGSLNGVTGNNPTSYTYPSAVGECGQGVVAAQTATKAGTYVYTIGYGAVTSGGCSTDQSNTATGNTSYGGGAWPNGTSKQPCDELAAMASNSVNFYSDDGEGCKATTPSNQNIKAMTAIFRAIANNMSGPRIIPNGTT
jgi:Flp pilus assembly protein TadG